MMSLIGATNFPISSLAHQGLDNLLEATAELLDKHFRIPLVFQKSEWLRSLHGFDEDQPALTSSRDDDAAWVLSSEKLEKLFNMTNFDRDEAVMKFIIQLSVDLLMKALVRVGQDDIVRISRVNLSL